MTVLQKALGQGFKSRDALEIGEGAAVSELSRRENQDWAFMFRSLSMVNLAPDIVAAVIDGSAPAKLTMATLRRGPIALPILQECGILKSHFEIPRFCL